MKKIYSWNTVNTDLLYGRDRLLQELLTGLPGNERQSFAITGGRRMGKTTILLYVHKHLSAREVWNAAGIELISVYIDGLSLPRPLTAEHLWAQIEARIRQRLAPTAGVAPNTRSFPEFLAVVRPLIAASTLGVRVVVLLDEIEHVLAYDWSDSFFSNWRALLSNMPDLSSSFAIAVSGARELATLQHDIGSPLMDILEWRLLRNLDYVESCKLMREPSGRRWPPELMRLVFKETGGHPMLLQYLMQHIVAGKPKDAAPIARKVVKQFSERRGWQFRLWWEKHCTPMAQRIYARLPNSRKYVPLTSLTKEFGIREANEALEILQHVGIVGADKRQLRFCRRGDMFNRWQQRFGSPQSSLTHDLEIFSKLQSVDPAIASKYASSWAIARSDLPNFSGAVSEMRDVITLIAGKLAPDDVVSAEPSFQFEEGQTRPTRRQRIRYIAKRKTLSKEQASSLAGDVELVGTIADQLAATVTALYKSASGLTHLTATRDRAFQALKQGDSVLAQLLL